MSVRAQSRWGVLFAVANFLPGDGSVLLHWREVPANDRANRHEGNYTAIVNPSYVSPVIPIGFNACTIESIARPGFEGARAKAAKETRLSLYVTGADFFLCNRAIRDVLRSGLRQLYVVGVG